MSNYVQFIPLKPDQKKEKSKVYYRNGVKHTKTVTYTDNIGMEIYDTIKCDICINPQMICTNDGNRNQQCVDCGRYVLRDGELV